MEAEKSPQSVCPWWAGYFLASPIRRLLLDPAKVLAPYVSAGMTVVEPGPGMGFFTVELGRRVGASGRVIAIDVQPKMLNGLKRRLAKEGLLQRVDVRLAHPKSMGIDDLAGMVDFVLAFAVVHEMPSSENFFREAARCLKQSGSVLLAEPPGHVKPAQFKTECEQAERAGLSVVDRPVVGRNQTAFFTKGSREPDRRETVESDVVLWPVETPLLSIGDMWTGRDRILLFENHSPASPGGDEGTGPVGR